MSDYPCLCCCHGGNTSGTAFPLRARARARLRGVISSAEQKESAGKERDCDLMCVWTIHTHPPPQETAVADKRSKGDSSIYPSTHPSIHPPSTPLHGLRPLWVGQAHPQLGQRGSSQPASLPGNQSKRMSVGTSSWAGLVAGRGPPGEYSREQRWAVWRVLH